MGSIITLYSKYSGFWSLLRSEFGFSWICFLERVQQKATHRPFQDIEGTGIISHQPFKKPEMEKHLKVFFL